jgi:hypothetical protein
MTFWEFDMDTRAIAASVSTAKKLDLEYKDWLDILDKFERLDAYELNVLIANLLALQARQLPGIEARKITSTTEVKK